MGVSYSTPQDRPVADVRRLRPFESVRLLEDLPSSAVMFLDETITPSVIVAGAVGAVLDVYDDVNGVYEVELTEPVPAVVTLRRHQIERL